MSQDAPIHSWPGSYYVNGEKRWVSGTLSLTRKAVRFTSEQSRDALASFPLSRIVELKMESSSFIFSALTVLEQGNVKHWFGSLRPCRAAVFHVLEHFWRERLLSPSEAQAQAPLSKGQELISLVTGAQRRLADTGKVLNHQGEQFDNMMQGLDKIESDLGVADKLLSELESPPWWPFGKLPWRSQQEAKAESAAKAPPPRGSGKAQKVICSVPAVVGRGGDSGELKPGSLTLLPSTLELRDASGQLIHRFEREEVDDIRVQNPYEISIRQRFIGKPDICYRLLSARMAEALSVLEVQYKKKVEFTGDYTACQGTPSTTPDSGAAFWGAGAHGLETEVPVEIPAGDLTQVQLHVLQPTVTEAEAQELKQMLLQLKSLALEAETELERQDEALDVLTSSSERATMSIDKHTRRMRKLL
ncbi:synaptosomal-associated protein 47 [Pygocentrus nattereri]|uniref:Synaptosomal-associated protein 47 n=1 Tax=Pygocentrus nattereri TaxID=42514 RepID=A0A3B4BKU2_PYGNA|nr:synaptosomal-associated protein 47 [Pygocentrus nattereri]XP_017542414.1 synaptosomal-associated protein 47 [Pygocentrus nattereri]XP_017542415.1 synaptosomal-associated protein 47 [Pygocentrus nattereri]XP_037388258.1 synaptosomal-associated protein 47 [Pygocentrus nattereri]